MIKKKVFIVHCWGGNKDSDWYMWLKNKLEEKGFQVTIFNMPDTENPKIKEWIGFLEKNIKLEDLNENTYFIGHSIGCQAIMRYLETLSKNIKIGGCLFVAGWFNLRNLENKEVENIARPWMESPIDFKKIQIHVNNIIYLFSDDDPYLILDEKDANKFNKLLHARIFKETGYGHFNGTEYKVILNAFEELIT
jgi:hypothetical protein